MISISQPLGLNCENVTTSVALLVLLLPFIGPGAPPPVTLSCQMGVCVGTNNDPSVSQEDMH